MWNPLQNYPLISETYTIHDSASKVQVKSKRLVFLIYIKDLMSLCHNNGDVPT